MLIHAFYPLQIYFLDANNEGENDEENIDENGNTYFEKKRYVYILHYCFFVSVKFMNDVYLSCKFSIWDYNDVGLLETKKIWRLKPKWKITKELCQELFTSEF